MLLKSVGVCYQCPPNGKNRFLLKEISLSVDAGEFVCLMGRTGSGKSTLLRVLSGFAKPDSGTVLLNGEPIYDKKYDRALLRKSIGLLLQYPENQLFEKTAARDVAFGLKGRKLPREEESGRVREAMERVGLSFEKLGGESPWALSEGQKRLLAIAGVLVVRPALLLLDEPLAGLDSHGRKQVLTILSRLRDEGAAILMVSHDADAAARYADRVLLMEEGRLAADGSPAELLSGGERSRLAGLGSSRAAELSCLLKSRGFLLPDGIIRYDELLEALLQLRKGGGAS